MLSSKFRFFMISRNFLLDVNIPNNSEVFNKSDFLVVVRNACVLISWIHPQCFTFLKNFQYLGFVDKLSFWFFDWIFQLNLDFQLFRSTCTLDCYINLDIHVIRRSFRNPARLGAPNIPDIKILPDSCTIAVFRKDLQSSSYRSQNLSVTAINHEFLKVRNVQDLALINLWSQKYTVTSNWLLTLLK